MTPVKTYTYGNSQDLVIYCNGICANQEDPNGKSNLEEQIELLTRIFKNSTLLVFNNPTGLVEYFSRSPEQTEREAEMALQLGQVVRERLLQSASIKLIAHSHGALLVKIALENLAPDERAPVSVYTFGGAVMIPKTLTHEVQNFVFQGDLLSRLGNKALDPKGVLEKVICVHNRMQREPSSLNEAICEEFLERFLIKLDPTGLSAEHLQKYVATFWTGNPLLVPDTDAEYTAFTACFTDYEIKVFNSPAEVAPNNDLRALSPELRQRISIFGIETDRKWHKLSAFESTLSQLV